MHNLFFKKVSLLAITFFVVIICSTSSVSAAVFPTIPDDSLDFKYKDYIAIYMYVIDSLQEKIDSSSVPASEIPRLVSLVTSINTMVSSLREKDQEMYVFPLERFGVKSTINKLGVWVGISGGLISVETDANEKVVGYLMRNENSVDSNFDAYYALYNQVSGINEVVESGYYSNATYDIIEMVLGSTLTDFLLNHVGFSYEDGYGVKEDECTVDFSVSNFTDEVDDLLDKDLNYDFHIANSATGTPMESPLEMIEVFYPNMICDASNLICVNVGANVPECLADAAWEARHK